MKSTRERILISLLKNPQSTISDLAKVVSINPISVRHHINSLLADKLIKAEEERHGVGRPRLVYALTEEGLERFPTRYFRLINRILVHVKDTMTSDQISDIFKGIAKDVATDHQNNLKSLKFDEKLSYIEDFMEEEGFVMDWEEKDDQYIIHEVTCPYFHVVQTHPEVCRFDQTLISELLNMPLNKSNCILNGDLRCSYIIKKDITMERI
jgi:predicted ArsR family transcriptional regulator